MDIATQTGVKAEELRLGNWVAKPDGLPYEVNIKMLSVISSNLYWVAPIPLTPEILKKAGFKWNFGSKHEMNLKISIKHNWARWPIVINAREQENGFYEGSFRVDKFWAGHRTFKHLHQLQNLYFALTNTELNITL